MLITKFLPVLLLMSGGWAHEKPTTARWCVISQAEEAKCKSMKTVFTANGFTPTIECVQKATAEECYITIREGIADLITLDGGDVYRAGKVFGLKPIMKEIYNGSTGYYGIAVIKAENQQHLMLSNLAGARTCHTGVGRTAGWNIPVGYLLHSGQMASAGCKEHVKSAANFFNSSCAPGALLSTNNPYSDDFSNLCENCAGDCGRGYDTEPYNGYSGALRCLLEGAGDVAFIKPATLEANIGEGAPVWAKDVTNDDLRLLCKDGTNASVTDAENCHIARGVSHSVMTAGSKSDEDIAIYKSLLTNAMNMFANDSNTEFTMFDSTLWGGRNLIFKDYATNMTTVDNQTYEEYLGGYGESFEGLQKCPEGTLRFCTISEQEQQKCRAMRKAFMEEELSPAISCFPASSHADCIDSIAAGFADIVVLDGGDIHRAGKDNGLIPILGEVYTSGSNAPVSYWAVAVAKASSNFTINDLRNLRSCHTGIMKTSGWIMPVGYLVNNGHINLNQESCDVTRDVGNFFSSSCAPGAKSTKYDINGTNPESLCANCIGKDEENCSRSSHEPYYGYSGAFRCLAEDAGDIAFVKHTTVVENTHPNGDSDWNRYLRRVNYDLVCPDGSRKKPWQFRQCNLGVVPSHAMMTSGGKKDSEILDITNLFLTAKERFNDEAGDGFKLFDSAGVSTDGKMVYYLDSDGQRGKDLLFKDATVNLKNVPSKRTYNLWLGSIYLNALETIKCD